MFLGSKGLLLKWVILPLSLFGVIYGSLHVFIVLGQPLLDKALLVKLANRGIKLSYRESEYGLGHAAFRNMIVSEPVSAVLGDVQVEYSFSLYPFELKVDRVKLSRVEVREKVNNLLDKIFGRQSTIVQDSTHVKPPGVSEFDLEDLYVELHHSSVMTFHFKKIRFFPGSGYIKGVLKQFSVSDTVVNNGFNFELKKSHPSKWRYLLSPVEDKKIWSLNGWIDPKEKRVKGLGKMYSMSGAFSSLGEYVANMDTVASAIKYDLKFVSRSIADFDFQFGLANLKLSHGFISPNIVGPTSTRMRLSGRFDIDKRFFEVRSGSLFLKGRKVHANQLGLRLEGQYALSDLGSAHGDLNLTLTLPTTKCHDIGSIIPKGLMPVLQDFELSGNISAKLGLKLSTKTPENFKLDFEGNAGCVATPLQEQYSKVVLKNLDLKKPSPLGERFAEIQKNYTSLYMISPYVLKALTAFEDGSFYNHDGIEVASLIQAARTNIKEKRIKIGGSTITMQTAKNLYLTHERNLARKFQELFLSWYLEATLKKKDILEIYANIIEYGPGIYGIREAALVHFNKDPQDLTLIESAYLASVLPSPIKRFKNFCRGYLSARYRQYIDQRLRLMFEFKRLNQEELEQALASPLVFAQNRFHPYCQKIAGIKGNLPL